MVHCGLAQWIHLSNFDTFQNNKKKDKVLQPHIVLSEESSVAPIHLFHSGYHSLSMCFMSETR